MSKESRILIGKITAAHGLRGQVKLFSYAADPDAFSTYSPITDRSGNRVFEITITSSTSSALIASIEGITSREQAEALKGTEFYIPRSALPEPDENEFYIEDLVGIPVTTEDGKPFGIVKSAQNYGASDMLEITIPEEKNTKLFIFSHTIFPEIDIKNRKIIIAPPEEIE